MKKVFLILLIGLFSLNSCMTRKKVYTGKNIHQKAIGKTKNEILRTYGVPDRVIDDGLDGTVLIFEKKYFTTTSKSSSRYSDVLEENSVTDYSKTTEEKEYLYLFLDKNNVVYDYKSNYGDDYYVEKKLNKTMTVIVILPTLFPIIMLLLSATLS